MLRSAGETETSRGNIQDWLQLDEGDPGFQLLTEEEIAADVIKDSAMEEESDNELDELQLRRNFLALQEMALMQ
jgi:hypothetical protein